MKLTSYKEVIDLDFKVSENGDNLSNGEKQIINFLRVVLLDKDIIILDEATSNTDPLIDKIINE